MDKTEFPNYPEGGIAFRNPSSGEIIRTREEYDADVARMQEEADVAKAQGEYFPTAEEVLCDAERPAYGDDEDYDR